MSFVHSFAAVSLPLAVLMSPLSPAHAQSWPAKPVRAIVTVGPGTPTDLLARGLAQPWAQTIGQPVVVENRVGASGIIGTEACARSAPDGYTMCFTAWGQMSANPFLFTKLPYDPARDFAPVVRLCDISSAIAVHVSVPASSVRELLDLSRAKPQTLNWSSWGIGTPSHLYLAWLENRAGGNFIHVPYKESAQAWTAVLVGEAQVIANTTTLVASMAKAGKVKAIGTIGSRRSSSLPGVPTLVEQGLDFQTSGWLGLLYPAGVPRDIVQRINVETNRLLSNRDFAEKFMVSRGLEPIGGSPEEFAAFLQANRVATGELIKLANLKPQ